MDIKKLQTDLAALVKREADAEATEVTDLTAIRTTIAELRAVVAAGGAVSQADIDALDAQVTGVSDGLGTIVSGLDAAAKQ